MEYVDGCDLRRLVRPRGKAVGTQLPIEVALGLALQVADGLRYAHNCTDAEGRKLGIIHRDISPHNILISRDGHPKIADFGIARARISEGLSQPGAIIGKLRYMAPEQAKGLPIDKRVDVYGLGAVLYEMLTGRRAFEDRSSVGAAAEGRPADPPSCYRPSISAELDELVLKALAPAADDRFDSTRELGDALQEQLVAIGGIARPHQIAGLVSEALAAQQQAVFGSSVSLSKVTTQVASSEEMISSLDESDIEEASAPGEPDSVAKIDEAQRGQLVSRLAPAERRAGRGGDEWSIAWGNSAWPNARWRCRDAWRQGPTAVHGAPRAARIDCAA
jgi:serine/threonine protein kinase